MKRISTGLLMFLIAGSVLFLARETLAKEYLGFSPGTQLWNEVVLTLKSAHAVFKDNYGYQGMPTSSLLSRSTLTKNSISSDR